jgi:hypothetical protein
MLWSHVDWCKFCAHLRNSNVQHFGTVEGTGLETRHAGHLQWHDLPAEFQKDLLIGPEAIREDTHTDRQTDR